jgi:hypothetical protein
MPKVYIEGNPENSEETNRLTQDAFDDFMCKVPIEQRRFLRRFGFSETDIDEALRDPGILQWIVKEKQA